MKKTEYFKYALKVVFSYTLAFLRWLALGASIGVCGGVVGAAFARSVQFVTELRAQYTWLILLLPLGGLLSVAIYKLCRVTDIGTNHVFESVRSETKVPYLLAPAVFLGSVITHLFGGSAGREGAALQLGGSVASLLGRLLKLDEKTRHILTVCGMGAFFSALFGTPLGAAVFALEVVSVGHFCSAAFFPAIISSVTAYGIALKLGVHPERFALSVDPGLEVNVIWKVALIAVLGAFVSFLFCAIMHSTEHLFKKVFKNEFFRVAVGGVAIVLLTVLVGNGDYNGGGISVIERIFSHGDVRSEAFLLKILFTAITIAVGFKGGEIVPTLFIGATFGATLGGVLGLDLGLAAAVGMAALFCGVTNCPLATIVLCIELFGGKGMIFCALSAIISFLLSGTASLYTGQRFIFSKLNEDSFKNDTAVDMGISANEE